MNKSGREMRDPIPCTTEQFWQAMCRPAFVRISLHFGAIGLGQFSCDQPPELVEGFLQKKMAQTMRDLGYPTLLQRWRDWRRGYTDIDVIMGNAK